MAEGRMLKKEISDSKKLGALSSDRPRVLYFMMLPHLDIEGRLKADPKQIKGQICTMLPYSIKSIQSALEALHNAGLILLYQNSGAQFLEYARFGDFQKLYPDKEAESKILGPTPEDYGERGRTPLKVKGKESKTKESKYGEFVFLSTDEYKKLVEQFGEQQAKLLIEELDDAIGSKGYKYRSHYRTILNWYRRKHPPPPPKPTEEEVATAAQKKRERWKAKVRAEESDILREKSPEQLRRLRDSYQYKHKKWLIDEILKEKQVIR